MENSASKTRMGAQRLATDWLSPGSLKGQGMLGLAAAGHVVLIANAHPRTLPALAEITRLNPFPAMAFATTAVLVCVQASRLPELRLLLVRRVKIGLIAACLTLIAGDILNLMSVDHQPWAFLVAGSTGLVLLGGLTTLIADARAIFAR